MTHEIFASAQRSTGDLAGVFEYDGETGYFYLYETKGPGGSKVLDSIHVVSGPLELANEDVFVMWDASQEKVALFVRKVMWAVFDCTSGEKFGGRYKSDGRPIIPAELTFIQRR
jgi:hypothetical protein